VCRLELVFDDGASKMVVAPLETDYHVEPSTPPRTMPAPAISSMKKRTRI
jgi:hypothetical protein